jgi:hypothetical protein
MTNEAARHPFRQRLPRHVLLVDGPRDPIMRRPRSDDHDWKLFLLSFTAFFTVAYSFIF